MDVGWGALRLWLARHASVSPERREADVLNIAIENVGLAGLVWSTVFWDDRPWDPRALPPDGVPLHKLWVAVRVTSTGRVHLLLLSRSPGVEGRAIGVITLEDIIKEMISRRDL